MELRLMVPWAYSVSQHCIINSQGVVGTRYLYFFSDNHSIANVTRAFQGKGQSIPQPNPFKQPSVHFRDKDLPAHMNWLPPPIKSFFQVPRVRDVLGSRPLVIIHNKYVSQWGQPPSNFLSVDLLRKILRYLTTKYEVLYKRFVPKELEEKAEKKEKNSSGAKVRDYSGLRLEQDLGEKQMIRAEFPSVVLFEDLAAELDSRPEDQNLLLLGLMASSERFISVQGGTAVLSSYFGGNVTLLAVRGAEASGLDDYFHRFSNADVYWERTNRGLLERIKGRM